jgi:hypothetical protein
MRQLL